MLKRVLSLLLAINLLISVFPLGVFAGEMQREEFPDDEFNMMQTDENLFQFNESTGTIEYYLGTYQNIAIPETIRGVKTQRIKNYAFSSQNLKNIIIPDSIIDIGDGAFSRNQLKNVVISENVVSIGRSAFQANQLTNINIPKGVTEISEFAFSNNQLKNVTLSGNVTSIGRNAFTANQITSIEIPKSVTRIEHFAFESNKLTNVIIPDGLTIIENYVFADNQLTNIIIPNGITSIGSGAFAENQLTDIIIPDSVTEIGYRAFYKNPLRYISIPRNTTDIFNSNDTIPSSAIIIAEENSAAHTWARDKGMSVQLVGKTANFDLKGGESYFPSHTVNPGEPLVEPKPPTKEGAIFKNWRTDKGDVYDFRTITEDITIFAEWEETIPEDSPFEFDKSTGTITGYTGTEVNVVIPEKIQGVSVLKIGDNAFREKQLQSVIIPNSVTSIGDNAFRLNQLHSINIPNSVTSIGNFAFLGNQLLSIVIPDSVKTIGGHAFQANQLAKVILPNNMDRINQYTFAGNQLKEFIIPDSVIRIDEMAFYMNPLEYISISRNTDIIGAEAIPSSAILIAEENSTAHTWAINNSRSVQLVGRTASFDLKGGEGNFSPHTVKLGEPLFKPGGIPKKEGATFKNWRTSTEPVYDFRTITEDIIIYPEWEETIPDEGEIIVNHIDIDTKEVLDTEILTNGQETYTINFGKIAGYTLIGSSLNLTAKDKTIILEFKYKKEPVVPATATIQIHHIDVNTGDVLETETLTKELGTYIVNSKEIPGYTLADDASKEITLTIKDEVVTVKFNYVKDPTIESVESLADIEVAYGTERSSLALPSTVQVRLSDQTLLDLGVTWNNGNPVYDGNTVGEYTFTGKLAQDVANPQNLTAQVKVVVHPKPAEPSVVSSVESFDDIEVAYGTERSTLPLPFTVQVMLSDQTNRSLGVTWDNGSPVYNGNTAGEYTFTGTLAQDVSNPQGLTAEVKVIVNPKPAEPPVVSSVESLDDIEVSYGTERSALPFPPTVQVTLSDQSNQSLGVTWDGGSPVYNGNTAGKYTFTGTLAQDVSNPQGLKGEVKVVVRSSEPDPKSPIWPNGSELTVSDITKTSVKLSWPEAQDTNGVIGYRIYVDSREAQFVTSSVYEQTVTGLTAGTAYTFTVKAFNVAGNESEPLSAKVMTDRSSSGRGGGSGGGFGGGRVLSSNADLEELHVWAKEMKLELSPYFTSAITSYTTRTEAEQVEITVKPVHSATKVMLKGQVITDRTKVNLEEGDNKLVLIVQAENGSKKEYTLNIGRETPKPSELEIHFTDIAGHWAENYIKCAAAKGIVSGYPDGTFKPNRSVTRAEFTVMLADSLKLVGKGVVLAFTDNDQISEWAKKAVGQAVQVGIVGGYEDGSFRPNAQITRVEMVAMIARALKLPLKSNTVTGFADDEAIPQWAKNSVEAIRGIGIVDGRGGNRFVPSDKATRAEATAMLIRMLERTENQ